MFEPLSERVEARALERAAARRERIAARLREGGLDAVADGDAVVLSGRGLGRRYARDPALRWRIGEAADER